MKVIHRTGQFKRHYQERVAHNEPLQQAFQASMEAFRDNPEVVGAHPLDGKMSGRWSFWITSDYRVVYHERKDAILLLDIGTHEQVYER